MAGKPGKAAALGWERVGLQTRAHATKALLPFLYWRKGDIHNNRALLTLVVLKFVASTFFSLWTIDY